MEPYSRILVFVLLDIVVFLFYIFPPSFFFLCPLSCHSFYSFSLSYLYPRCFPLRLVLFLLLPSPSLPLRLLGTIRCSFVGYVPLSVLSDVFMAFAPLSSHVVILTLRWILVFVLVFIVLFPIRCKFKPSPSSVCTEWRVCEILHYFMSWFFFFVGFWSSFYCISF